MPFRYPVIFGGFVAFSNYLPTYIKTIYDFTVVDTASRTAGFAVSAAIARPVGGALSDRILPKYVVLASFAGTALLALVAVFQPPPTGSSPPNSWAPSPAAAAGAPPLRRNRIPAGKVRVEACWNDVSAEGRRKRRKKDFWHCRRPTRCGTVKTQSHTGGWSMPKGQELDVLSRRQCLDLLQRVRVGRLVFTEDALPAVQPVNFRVSHDDVIIRVAGGGKLSAAAGHQVVAFQADELDPDLRTGWSVTVVGHAEPITDIDELVKVAGTFVQPWVDGRRDHFVRIRTERITGRQIRERGVPHYQGVEEQSSAT
jgi:nitroimidazol reductase NimA-like FMN-containing flavoprotein (pyridoxamine 5'-phosphate oxidase superfamily)